MSTRTNAIIMVELTPETLERLQDDARAQGKPPETLAAAHIAAAYAPAPIPQVADEDADAYAALVAEGDADFAAGRFQTGEALREQVKQRHGLRL